MTKGSPQKEERRQKKKEEKRPSRLSIDQEGARVVTPSQSRDLEIKERDKFVKFGCLVGINYNFVSFLLKNLEAISKFGTTFQHYVRAREFLIEKIHQFKTLKKLKVINQLKCKGLEIFFRSYFFFNL